MSTLATTYTVAVDADKAGSRLDRLLADALPDLSRTRLQGLIAAGKVIDGSGRSASDPSLRVRIGQVFAVLVPPPSPETPPPQALAIDVVYEDDHLLVVDKPAGLVVHPGAGNLDGTLVNALLAHTQGRLSSIGAPLRPGIVHRIDKDTSGLLVVAKTDDAHRILARQFAQHTVERAYHAVVWGNPNPPKGRIDKAIGRSHDRIRMAAVTQGGKPAVTYYETRVRYRSTASLIECRLASGRTHQIRVHLSSIGHPLIGDKKYGRSANIFAARAEAAQMLASFPRQALHAYLIGFSHPASTDTLRFRSRNPSDFNGLIDCLEKI
ncbi:MAG: RluA family pseudouridine synthase [Rhodospirillales bacterium]|nr:RluA family pseudouridine synthase [Rhodospirillales bacterium]